MRTEALGVTVRFATDKGPCVARRAYRSQDVPAAVRDLLKALEADGIVPLKVLRVFTQPVPVIAGEAAWTLAGPMQRVPEGRFAVRQEMLT